MLVEACHVVTGRFEVVRDQVWNGCGDGVVPCQGLGHKITATAEVV